MRRHTAAALLDLPPWEGSCGACGGTVGARGVGELQSDAFGGLFTHNVQPATADLVLILGAVPPSRGMAPSGLVLGSPVAELCNRGTFVEAMPVEDGLLQVRLLRMPCPQVALGEALDWVRGLGLFGSNLGLPFSPKPIPRPDRQTDGLLKAVRQAASELSLPLRERSLCTRWTSNDSRRHDQQLPTNEISNLNPNFSPK